MNWKSKELGIDMVTPCPQNSKEELPKNCPKEQEVEGRISKKQWEWSSIEAGNFTFRKPLFESGKWRCRKTDRATGKRHRITLKAKTSREAKQEILGLVEKEKTKPAEESAPRSISLKTGFAEWLNTIDVREVTYNYYKAVGNIFMKILGEDKQICNLTYEDVEGLFSNNWKKLKGRSKIAYRNILKRFMDWAVKHSYCKENIVNKIEIQKKWIQEQRDGALYTAKNLNLIEARRLLWACNKKDITPFSCKTSKKKPKNEKLNSMFWFILIALRTGLRCSNIVGSEYKHGLTWNNLNLKEGILYIDKDFMKNGIELRIPLHDELWSMLKQRLESMGRIPAGNEKLVGIHKVKDGFNSALKRAGLQHYRIHDLRHSFATWLGEFTPYSVLKALLGHSKSSITDRYIHLDIDILRENLNKLPWITKEDNETKAKIKNKGL